MSEIKKDCIQYINNQREDCISKKQEYEHLKKSHCFYIIPELVQSVEEKILEVENKFHGCGRLRSYVERNDSSSGPVLKSLIKEDLSKIQQAVLSHANTIDQTPFTFYQRASVDSYNDSLTELVEKKQNLQRLLWKHFDDEIELGEKNE